MKNRFMMALLVLLPVAIVAIDLPQDVMQDLEFAKRQEEQTLKYLYSDEYWQHNGSNSSFRSIGSAMRYIEFKNSKNNIHFPCEIGRISDQDMKIIERDLHVTLQNISERIAKEKIEEYTSRDRFSQAANIVTLQDKLCRDVIKAEGSENNLCDIADSFLRKLLETKINQKDALLTNQIHTAPQKLEDEIKKTRQYSQECVTRLKKQQEFLRDLLKQNTIS